LRPRCREAEGELHFLYVPLNQLTPTPDTLSAVRRALVLTLLVAVAAPAAALAEVGAVPADGTLSVKGGHGFVSLNIRGAAIGLVGLGRVEIEAPKDDDCDALNVWGAEDEKTRLKPARVKKGETTADLVTVCVFTGKDVRFRLIGQYLVRLDGKNISLSAVGRGPVAIRGTGGLTDGTYAVNGGDYTSLPDETKRFQLAPQPPAPPLSILP
jgi:hypothetical protein